ncbi:hypothetical protein FJ938_19930 [Mesorhizobium sp. B2-4-14]|uniref:hypothetical protein n=1 Tax=Mesorhizobium sp. B2-4-14 TaxID=2589935 RepID=UPI00112CFFCA|nr:hypothetical protein [Mesorhizobium sp. B2-4-14]TPL02244.1 hypothetical protein FJ938_19930 [Mesorhizobium sp. B2-4-14]
MLSVRGSAGLFLSAKPGREGTPHVRFRSVQQLDQKFAGGCRIALFDVLDNLPVQLERADRQGRQGHAFKVSFDLKL